MLIDHTGQRGGQFVAAEDDSVWSPQTLTAKLLSPLHVETSDRLLIYCFSFYFSARSSCSDTLRFEVRLDNQKTLFIYGHETSPSRWLRKQITFTAKGSFRLQVAATYRSGIVAFDKPQLMHGFCGSSLNRTQSMVEHNHIKAINFERDSASELSDSLCDFELNDCGFFSNNFYRFSRIPMGQVSIQPSIDHSTRSAKGKAYVFDLSDKLSRTVSPASLFFPLLYFKDNVCLSFWLNVAGSASIDIQMNQVQRLLVLPQMEPDNAWYPQFMQLNQLDYVPMKLAFNVQPSNERNGFVAIDDVQLITGMCPPAICSFDLPDQCAWRTVSGHFDYTEVNGQNRSIDDLLPYEVVSGHGNFPTTDASIGTVDGFFIRPVSKVVVLQSPKLFTRSSSSPDIYCLHYAYYQTSDDDSDDRLIRVLVRFGGSKSIARELFTLHTPNTSYAWKRQQVPIDGAMLRSAGVDPKRGEFSILLVLGKETKPIRNLAFDDIGIIAGRCARHEMFFCEIGKKPASEHLDWAQVCDFRRDCANGRDEQVCATCEFEKDLCGYHMFREVYDQKTNATNLLRDIARSVDIRNGIEFQERSLLMRSRHTLKEAPVNCELRFRYRYRNVHLQVNRLTTSQQTRLWSSREFGLPDTLIDSVETDVNPASIELHMFRSGNIRLEFVFERVVPSNNESSWVALDWIRLENCDRPVKKALDVKWIGMSTTISPLDPDLFSSKKMFTCKNGQKIDASLECDLANDCEDYTDEADCYWNKYSTHFELGSKRLHRKGDWYLFKSLSTLTAPDFDHTSGTSSGTYLLLSGALNLSRTSGSGWLMVPTINPQFDCDLRLFYRTNRADATSIRVTWLSMNDATIRYVEQRNLSLASRWTRTVFSISHDVSNQRPWIEGLYRIAIEAKFNSGQADSNAYLAIDDISLSRGCYVRQPKDADCFMNSGDMINCNWQFVMSRQQKQRFHLVKSTWSRLTIADIPIQMETALSHIILFVGQTSFDRLEAKLAKQEIEADHYVELKEPETTFFVNDSASIDLNVIHFQSPEFDCTSRDKNQVWNLVIHAALFGQHTGSLEVVEVTSNERIWRSDGRLGHFGGIVVPFDCPLGRNRQLDVRFRIDGPMSVVVLFDVIVQTNRLTKPLVCDFDTSSDCHLIIPIGLHFHVRNRWLDRSGSTSASSQSFDQVPDQTMKTSSGGLMYAQCAPDRKLTMVLSNTGPIAFWFRRVRSKICPTSKARPMRISVRNLFGSAPIVWWSHTFLDKQNLGSIEEFDEDDWQQAAFEYISSSRAFSLKGQNRLRIDCGDSNDWILFDQFGPLARPELNDAFYCEFEHDSLCNWVGRTSDGVGGWLQSQIHETVFQDVSSYRPNVSIASDQTLNRVEPANNFVYISFDSLSLHREYRLTSPLYAAKRRCLRFSYWMSERAKLRVQVLSVMEGNVQELTVLTESRRHWTEAQVQLHSELINVGQQIIIVVRNLDPHAVHTTSTFALDSIFSDLGHCSGLDQDSDYLQDDFDDGLVTIIEDSNEGNI